MCGFGTELRESWERPTCSLQVFSTQTMTRFCDSLQGCRGGWPCLPCVCPSGSSTQ